MDDDKLQIVRLTVTGSPIRFTNMITTEFDSLSPKSC